MFSLIVTIISVALAVGVTGATMYYIGYSTDQGGTTATAAELLTQSEQIAAAIDMRGIRENTELSSVAELVTANYLTDLPTPPKAAYAELEPLNTDWKLVMPARRPLVILQEKIKEDVCLAFNKKFYGNTVITTTINPNLRIQCYGPAAPYSVLINPSLDSGLLSDSITTWNDAIPVSTEPTSVTPITQPQVNGGNVVHSGQVSLAVAELPIWKVGQEAINYDFKTLFSDSVDKEPVMAEVVWSIDGILPTGLSLDPATGVLAGTPTVKGKSYYAVKATYKNSTGQQTYKIEVQGIELEVSSLSTNYSTTCAVTPNGDVKCWGFSGYGIMNSLYYTPHSNVPKSIAGFDSDVVSVHSGDWHACVITKAGGAKCWGRGNNGQLGNNSTVSAAMPVNVNGLESGVASIVAGEAHTCALTTAGSVMCWGFGAYGELGTGSKIYSAVPINVSNLTEKVTAIAAGTNHTCAVMISGSVKCWGRNNYGQLGNNSTTDSRTPVNVSGLASDITSVSASRTVTCVVTKTGDAKCWGSGEYGNIGDGYHMTQKVPVKVKGLDGQVASINAGDSQTCAVTKTGGAFCWGYRNLGASPNSDLIIPYPTQVYGLTEGVASIHVGLDHICVAMISGGAKCWGSNNYGQLGINAKFDTRKLIPTDVVTP